MTNFIVNVFTIGIMPVKPITKSQEKLLKRLGEKVKSIRKSKDLTLEDVGNRIGKDRQSIHKFESGSFNPTYLYLLEICKGLEIDITELLEGLTE